MNGRLHGCGPGFTLLELLVVIGIIGVLASLLLPALSRAKQQAKRVNEINAGRQLMFAWQMYADENGDLVLPGYSSRVEAWDDQGNPLGSPIRDRYPWRLAPHLSHSFRGIYVNESRHFLDEAESMAHGDFVYRASLHPSLGYNSVFLGGDEQKFNPELAAASFGTDWLVTRAAQIQRPSELLAFASARSRSNDRPDEPGYFAVYSPYLRTRQWEAEFQAASAPEDWGYVHPRWNRRAVVALTDGHTETMTDAELQDMRHWANPADRPDWTLPMLTSR